MAERNIRDFLVSATGKVHNLNRDLLSPSTKTLKLRTGSESKFLALDIDKPFSETNKRLLKYIDENDFLVYSSQYTVDDVLNGRCRYKVVYYYNSDVDIPKKQNPSQQRKDVELFFNKANHCLVSIAGKRDDGYEYLFTKKKPKELHFDLQDIYLEKVDKFRWGKETPKAREKKQKKIDDEKEEEAEFRVEEIVGEEEVDINEFSSIASQFVQTLPIVEKKGTLLTFPCLFPQLHTSKNQAYAFKRNGVYQARCFGEVCQHEYEHLNGQLKKFQTQDLSFPNAKGFDGLQPFGVNVFIAGVGWGKTETIANEILIAIEQKRKLLVLMQSKEAIERLLDRVNVFSGGRRNMLEENGYIYKYVSENKGDGETFVDDIEKANVIVSHHDYFRNAGNVLTYFKTSWDVLDLPNLEVIIDEAHTYLEKATRLDLEIGGAYTKPYGDFSNNVLVENRSSLTREEFINDKRYKVMTKCMTPVFSNFGTLEFRKEYKLLTEEAFGKNPETQENIGTPYLDIYKEIKNRFTKIDEFVEGHTQYRIYRNTNVMPIKPNLLDEKVSLTDGVNLLLDSAEDLVIAINQGDDFKRKKIGNITLSLYHTQIIKKILGMRKVTLTSATMMEYHYDILKKFGIYHTQQIETKIAKVGHIILLKANDTKASRPRNAMMEMTKEFAENEMDTRFLFFMPTIRNCEEYLDKYAHTMMNDNGRYKVGKRKSHRDYVDNMLRNVTLVGLEASPSKGYNYLEEIEADSLGFEMIYFDQSPVSPQVIKKYFNADGKLVDHSSDYNISTFTQAIGRAFRKDKKTLTVALNNIDDETYNMIKEHLSYSTNAVIVEGDLNISNVKVSINSWVQLEGLNELKNRLRNNKLFREIYLDRSEG